MFKVNYGYFQETSAVHIFDKVAQVCESINQTDNTYS